jgi:hypothetical protein
VNRERTNETIVACAGGFDTLTAGPLPPNRRRMNMDRKIEKEKEKLPQIIDLAGDDVEDTEIIKVGKRLYRVAESILDASPPDYSRGLLEGLGPRYCLSGGVTLANDNSPWAEPLDVRCIVCRDGHSRQRNPYCVYCGEPMIAVLPFEVLLHRLRFLWVCPDHHSWLVSDSIEGV